MATQESFRRIHGDVSHKEVLHRDVTLRVVLRVSDDITQVSQTLARTAEVFKTPERTEQVKILREQLKALEMTIHSAISQLDLII